MRKIIEIVGGNYRGSWTKTRTACRAVVMDGDRILLSYETKTDQWMLPGGGVEGNESPRECVVREVGEETGMRIEPSECVLEIDEYYGDWKWVNRYFLAEAVGDTQRKPTPQEIEAGMEPRWLPVSQILSVFSDHKRYEETDEMRAGMYLREYTALTEILGR